MTKPRQAYPTDVNDTEWLLIEQLLPAPVKAWRLHTHSYREILNAIFYIVCSGCAWRLLPHDLPPWKKVYTYFRRWRKYGTRERVHTGLREVRREQVGLAKQPSAAKVDPFVKTQFRSELRRSRPNVRSSNAHLLGSIATSA